MDYKNVNDYEMLYLIGEDKDESYDIMYQKYLPIIKKIASKYSSLVQQLGMEYQDLIQEGFLGLNSAIVRYREDMGTLFYTFACVCIERHINSFCYRLSAKKHSVLNNSISDDKYSCYYIRDNSFFSNYFTSSNKELEEIIFDKYYSLDLDTRCVFELRYNGFSYREISQLLDISVSKVDSKLSKARRFLKKVLEKYELN